MKLGIETLEKIYGENHFTIEDIKAVQELNLTIAELDNDTRLFEDIKAYTNYVYHQEDKTPIKELTQFMTNNKDRQMNLKDVLLYDNAIELSSGQILLVMG